MVGETISSDYERECPRCGGETIVKKVDDEISTPTRTCTDCPWTVSKTSTTYTGPSLDEQLDELEARIEALEAKLGGDD